DEILFEPLLPLPSSNFLKEKTDRLIPNRLGLRIVGNRPTGKEAKFKLERARKPHAKAIEGTDEDTMLSTDKVPKERKAGTAGKARVPGDFSKLPRGLFTLRSSGEPFKNPVENLARGLTGKGCRKDLLRTFALKEKAKVPARELEGLS